MVALSLLTFVSLAVYASAANFKRVACPDGKNTATNGPYRNSLMSLFVSKDYSGLL